MTDSSNKIENPQLSTSLKEVKPNEQVAFRIDFKIEGKIRQVFDQKNWERAYNLHDNIFRIKIDVDLNSGSKKLSIAAACARLHFSGPEIQSFLIGYGA